MLIFTRRNTVLYNIIIIVIKWLGKINSKYDQQKTIINNNNNNEENPEISSGRPRDVGALLHSVVVSRRWNWFDFHWRRRRRCRRSGHQQRRIGDGDYVAAARRYYLQSGNDDDIHCFIRWHVQWNISKTISACDFWVLAIGTYILLLYCLIFLLFTLPSRYGRHTSRLPILNYWVLVL